MAIRKDLKGRKLKEGETQRKDGKYCYTYRDCNGKRKSVYSWKLDVHDRVPSGKRETLSLREIERQIEHDMQDGIISCGGGYTVSGWFERFLFLKRNIKPRTVLLYQRVLNILKDDSFGSLRIDEVTASRAKVFFISLQDEKGYSFGTLKEYHIILKSAFNMAFDDGLIRRNPLNFSMSSVLRDDTMPKEALTEEQMSLFLDYLRNDSYYRRYYDAVFILLNTGMRSGELSALTTQDIDLENREIIVKHQTRRSSDGVCHIEPPKSVSSVRMIPIASNELYVILARLVRKANERKMQPMIDGCRGFIFCLPDGMPTYSETWTSRFKCMNKGFNKSHPEEKIKITPHICRHTYLSRLNMNGVNPKVIQAVAGHANVNLSMNRYVHIQDDDVKKELMRFATN